MAALTVTPEGQQGLSAGTEPHVSLLLVGGQVKEEGSALMGYLELARALLAPDP